MNLRVLTPEQQGGLFISNLKKGDIFNMLSKTYTVISKTNKGMLVKMSSGENIQVKFLNNINYGNHKTEQFFREIESQLTIDLLNELNPFHVLSDVYNICKNS